MPTLMTLQGADLGIHVIRDPNVDCASVHQPWQCSPGLADAADNAYLAWLRRQNPLLAGALVVSLAASTGLVVGWAMTSLLAPSPSRSTFHGAPLRRRRRR